MGFYLIVIFARKFSAVDFLIYIFGFRSDEHYYTYTCMRCSKKILRFSRFFLIFNFFNRTDALKCVKTSLKDIEIKIKNHYTIFTWRGNIQMSQES